MAEEKKKTVILQPETPSIYLFIHFIIGPNVSSLIIDTVVAQHCKVEKGMRFVHARTCVCVCVF